MPIQLQEILSSLPPVWPDDLLPAIQRKNAQSPASIVVLDDDPTGTQTVHDVPVLTNWKLKTITDEFADKTPLFYLLTNSRSLTEAAAVNLASEVGANILEASRQTGRAFEIISRSDSTLRGHFPAEVDALADVLEMQQAVCLIIPFFQEGGRIPSMTYIMSARDSSLSPPLILPLQKMWFSVTAIQISNGGSRRKRKARFLLNRSGHCLSRISGKMGRTILPRRWPNASREVFVSSTPPITGIWK